ncbi:Ubiquinol oxidase (electrogenic, non H(+)-transporting) [Lentibacillus sp. JNUCC-1]|uniref:cytochrome ubiquinol oxidase subunit I n=1 Tax=Lentibacillus sp. JNUCC-1 TaxID=2654513 RepID=UPI0012E904B4|nr:cytochrome ubiquinol oxidase subunit I [Lentibacillus sp. JNUCC-1]MUV36386.1 Ubiquinol oxidase (electrogenic, non H(+)-transporting) [Lentibacillus sp. JNUCC-1]
MDPLVIARLQFASTTIFHYFFVPVSIGLAFTIAIMQTLYVFKKKDVYRKMTKFWSVLFLINFAVGVVTGIFQEFQFGMNWSTYSRFVGDVFGPSLAIEGLLAFFLESTFIAVWVFGWNRLPKKVHLASIWLVAIGTILSAFWILSANSFMQNPVGFEIAGERAQMNNFAAILTNPHLWAQFPHVLVTSLVTGGFVIASISAWKLLRKQDVEMFKRSFRVSIIVATSAAFLMMFTGHWQAQYLVESQPMKMAAAEALWENSGDPAPFTVYASINTEENMNDYELQIPYMLSFLSYNKFSGSLEGLNQLQADYEEKYGPGDYIPSVPTVFWAFRIMTGSGGLLLLLGLYGGYVSRRNKTPKASLYLKIMPFAMALPFVANTAGWIMTEMGRQPWVVFGMMKTEDAVSPSVTANEMLFSLVTFTLIYAILAALTVYLFSRHIKKPVFVEEEAESNQDPFGTDEGGKSHVSS